MSAVEIDPRAAKAARGSSPQPSKAKRARRWRERAEIVGFTAPALIVFVLFVFVPIGYAVVLSLFDGTPTSPIRNFVGFQNFTEIFTTGRGETLGQPWFWNAVRNNFLIAAMSLLLQGPIAIGVALLLNRKMKFRGFFRLMIFVPYVLSEVITGVIFSLMLSPQGALNDWLTRLGFEQFANFQWLMDTSAAPADAGIFAILGSRTFWAVFAILTWKYVGLAIILFLAGLSGVPEELNEAAAIDGASWWQIQRKITIPLLGPTIRIWAFLSLIGSFQLFDMVWILTGQQPGRTGLHTMATFMVDQGMNRNRVGFGSAIAIVLFVITLIVALLYQRFILSRDLGKES
ncbi:carbohydrate ABC transporter permease [Xylanimonas ulmi]|uniref:Carbohydrate ABC transporter membrane protein 1 (CUT1 family) n=1 Tax=Xylanimonas ulmi TaxID=228973 RepID=A0A4Q7M3K2_9MICO|nr:sugar ABC transporter permease [Xylanibacterium ulmi]RZS61911.1 carbohydrate ABC transporter membrane protein 1 (CUT1 family) [Xylanibacterium ulmi]